MTRFQREAEAASALFHPNVVGVYDVNHTADGRPYIVAEFLEGEQLGDFLERAGKLPVPLAIHIVRQVCRALGAAHERGIVHRDIKPENIFLTGAPAAPVAKVLDFGISKLAGDATGLTKTGMVMGTPAYMAPEQARGDRVDHQADIYALGAILYRVVTGKRPFEEMDALATLTSVLTEDPPRPREIDPSVPDALEIVIQRAMAKDPADRYRTTAALEADLAAFDTGLPASGSGVTHDSAGSTFVKPVAGSSGDATARTVLAAGPAANQTVGRLLDHRLGAAHGAGRRSDRRVDPLAR
jgi:serine/threonine-protein kinase